MVARVAGSLEADEEAIGAAVAGGSGGDGKISRIFPWVVICGNEIALDMAKGVVNFSNSIL